MELFSILDGIISSDQPDEILADTDLIMNYAQDGLDADISWGEAERIQQTGKHWLSEMKNGNGEWSRIRHEAKAALEDTNAE